MDRIDGLRSGNSIQLALCCFIFLFIISKLNYFICSDTLTSWAINFSMVFQYQLCQCSESRTWIGCFPVSISIYSLTIYYNYQMSLMCLVPMLNVQCAVSILFIYTHTVNKRWTGIEPWLRTSFKRDIFLKLHSIIQFLFVHSKRKKNENRRRNKNWEVKKEREHRLVWYKEPPLNIFSISLPFRFRFSVFWVDELFERRCKIFKCQKRNTGFCSAGTDDAAQ